MVFTALSLECVVVFSNRIVCYILNCLLSAVNRACCASAIWIPYGFRVVAVIGPLIVIKTVS